MEKNKKSQSQARWQKAKNAKQKRRESKETFKFLDKLNRCMKIFAKNESYHRFKKIVALFRSITKSMTFNYNWLLPTWNMSWNTLINFVSLKTVPLSMFLIVPFGDFYIFLRTAN